MGKSTISMAIFNSYVKLPEGNTLFKQVPKRWTPEVSSGENIRCGEAHPPTRIFVWGPRLVTYTLSYGYCKRVMEYRELYTIYIYR